MFSIVKAWNQSLNELMNVALNNALNKALSEAMRKGMNGRTGFMGLVGISRACDCALLLGWRKDDAFAWKAADKGIEPSKVKYVDEYWDRGRRKRMKGRMWAYDGVGFE